jgi:hypothetical protein
MSVIEFSTGPDGEKDSVDLDQKEDKSKNVPEIIKKYKERGFRLIFYETKHKGPEGQEAVEWTNRDDQISDYKIGQNVGVFTGHEISPGKFLVDVDFDWTDGLPLAKRILPNTSFAYGRTTRTLSHAFYTSSEPLQSIAFKNIDDKPFVELRGTKQDGTIGLQTMVPPSIHPNGENLIIRADGEIAHIDDIGRRIALYAVACMVYSIIGHRGLLHDNRLALAGFLLNEGLTAEEASMVCASVAEACGNNVQDMELIVKTTAQKIKSGEHVKGKTALINVIGDDGKKIISRIKEWLGSEDFLVDSKGKILQNNQENVKRGIEKIGLILSFDSFAQKAMCDYSNISLNGNSYTGPLFDAIVDQSWLEIDEKFHFRPDKTFYSTVVSNIANKNKVHPVLDYLKSLKWDGVPRIAEWLIKSGGAADTEYVRAVSSIMLIAAVRRVTQPGCKYDEMVVLESAKQGLLKSTALRTLCPNEKWFSDDLPLNVDAKQIVERTLGKWIIEASDLSGLRASAIEHLKGMLSRQTDGPVRLAYGRIPVEQPRQFIIVGTTNSYSYLTDSTGNRRFWPIRIKQFDIDYIRENRDQIWAEAVSREAAGESIRLHPSLYAHATMQQERRRAEDPWETKLDEAFPRTEKHRLVPDQVWGVLNIPIERRDPASNNRVLNAMTVLGFRRVTVRGPDGKIVKGFARDLEEGQLELEENQ